MKSLSPYLKGGIVALALIVGIYVWYRENINALPVNQSPESFRLIDKMEKEGVPDFELSKMDGTKIRLSSLRGKIVIVNFWASWCNPCVEEFPSMIKLVDEMQGDVVVLAVSSDDDQKEITPFLKAFALPKPHFDVVWDADKKVLDLFGVTKVPESFVVGKDGKLIRKVLGIENWASGGAIDYFRMLNR